MAFQLKPAEHASKGILRNVRKQLEKAQKHLGTEGDTPRGGNSDAEVVGEVRKCFKKIRAALRLVREELGEDRYHEENYYFRDAARPLTQVRDAGILVETADQLRDQYPGAISPAAFAQIRHALLANQHEVRRRVLEEHQALATARDAAARALARILDLQLERDGWAALEDGIRRVYRAGHRALARAAESSSVEHLHEWRKQTKYLWHQLQLLELTLTGPEKELVNATHQLSTLLGQDHDLAVLHQTLAADPTAYGGHRVLKGVLFLIDRRRHDLEKQAFALGRVVYQDSPCVFTRRIEASMKHEDSHAECREA